MIFELDRSGMTLLRTVSPVDGGTSIWSVAVRPIGRRATSAPVFVTENGSVPQATAVIASPATSE